MILTDWHHLFGMTLTEINKQAVVVGRVSDSVTRQYCRLMSGYASLTRPTIHFGSAVIISRSKRSA